MPLTDRKRAIYVALFFALFLPSKIAFFRFIFGQMGGVLNN